MVSYAGSIESARVFTEQGLFREAAVAFRDAFVVSGGVSLLDRHLAICGYGAALARVCAVLLVPRDFNFLVGVVDDADEFGILRCEAAVSLAGAYFRCRDHRRAGELNGEAVRLVDLLSNDERVCCVDEPRGPVWVSVTVGERADRIRAVCLYNLRLVLADISPDRDSSCTVLRPRIEFTRVFTEHGLFRKVVDAFRDAFIDSRGISWLGRHQAFCCYGTALARVCAVALEPCDFDVLVGVVDDGDEIGILRCEAAASLAHAYFRCWDYRRAGAFNREAVRLVDSLADEERACRVDEPRGPFWAPVTVGQRADRIRALCVYNLRIVLADALPDMDGLCTVRYPLRPFVYKTPSRTPKTMVRPHYTSTRLTMIPGPVHNRKRHYQALNSDEHLTSRELKGIRALHYPRGLHARGMGCVQIM